MDDIAYKKSLSNFFRNLKLEKRNELMDGVLADRTRYITVALENIYQPHNASAVLRSCDCFGVQDVHIIENSYGYELNPHVSLGAAQWLNLHRHNILDNNTSECIGSLKKEGYRIGHIEAGMRSYDKRMLEEINRTVCDHCSDILFVYHEDYASQLARENITKNVFVVGKSMSPLA